MITDNICHVGNTAHQCRWGLFQDSDFAGDLEDSKSEANVSVSESTESEVLSLDAGLPMDGIRALELWDLVFACFSKAEVDRAKRPTIKRREIECAMKNRSTNTNTKTERHNNREVDKVSNVRCHKRKTFSLRTPVVHLLKAVK